MNKQHIWCSGGRPSLCGACGGGSPPPHCGACGLLPNACHRCCCLFFRDCIGFPFNMLIVFLCNRLLSWSSSISWDRPGVSLFCIDNAIRMFPLFLIDLHCMFNDPRRPPCGAWGLLPTACSCSCCCLLSCHCCALSGFALFSYVIVSFCNDFQD